MAEMQKLVYTFKNKRVEKFNYLLYSPKTDGEGLPMIVMLHGAGERGDDFELLALHGVPKYLREGLELAAIVVSPQCPSGMIWNNLTVELKEFIDFAIEKYGADPDRVSLTGISVGGFGTWEMGMSYPGFFSALAPVCGGGISWRVSLIGKTPVWAFHGDADPVVPIRNSVELCDRLNASGGNARLTVFHGVNHDSQPFAYETTKVIEWLVASKRT